MSTDRVAWAEGKLLVNSNLLVARRSAPRVHSISSYTMNTASGTFASEFGVANSRRRGT